MYVNSKDAAKYYTVSLDTLRRWDKQGKIKTIRTEGGHRRYFIPKNNEQNIIYARVSSSKQSDDLQRQVEFLRKQFPNYEIITDIASGINFKRKGFKTILDRVFEGKVKNVVVATDDRFTRYGFELFEDIFTRFGTKLYSVSDKQYKSPEQELSEDLLSIITVFTARYYGSRKYK